MSRKRLKVVAFATGLSVVGLGAGVLPSASAAVTDVRASAATDYVVVAKDAAALAAARRAVEAAGGTVTGSDAALAVLTATSTRSDFALRADASTAIDGVAANRKIGALPKRDKVTDELRAAGASALAARSTTTTSYRAPKADPFTPLQWDMAQIGATPRGSYAREQGSHAVLVGIMDTGVDGTHPDIKPNFNRGLSRNFVKDMKDIDGATCEHPSCVDPVDEDDDGHGTHVAGTIGSPLNGIGIAGVAPKVSLVNIRAGQDSGYFFLEPTIKALRYAGDAGIDVVNMSFYVDPWLYNCEANPADTPEQQAEQRAIIEATQRALKYAHHRNVTLVSALGNENSDLGNPPKDTTSPDYPANSTHERTIDNSTCLNLPAEGKHVIGVSAVGKSLKKADYSNYGLEQNDVAAPGGFYRDFATDTSKTRKPENLILAPMPRNVAVAADPAVIDKKTGKSVDPFVLADCKGTGPSHCAYWQYLQGTSMASPHAVGVVALIIARYGHRSHDGVTMNPDLVESILKRTATDVACPSSVITYKAEGRDATFDAPCVGTKARNSIYGDGIVNAARAVGAPV